MRATLATDRQTERDLLRSIARYLSPMGTITRSKNLAAYQPADTADHTVYTVPDDSTTIVKEICFWNGTGSTAQMSVIAQPAGSPGNFQIEFSSITDAQFLRFPTWAVLGPGAQLIVQSSVALTKFYISGAELSGVAP